MGHLFAPLFDGSLTAAVPAGLADASSTWLGLVLLLGAGLLGVGLDALRPVTGRGQATSATRASRGRRAFVVTALVLGVLALAATFVRFAASF